MGKRGRETVQYVVLWFSSIHVEFFLVQHTSIPLTVSPYFHIQRHQFINLYHFRFNSMRSFLLNFVCFARVRYIGLVEYLVVHNSGLERRRCILRHS